MYIPFKPNIIQKSDTVLLFETTAFVMYLYCKLGIFFPAPWETRTLLPYLFLYAKRSSYIYIQSFRIRQLPFKNNGIKKIMCSRFGEHARGIGRALINIYLTLPTACISLNFLVHGYTPRVASCRSAIDCTFPSMEQTYSIRIRWTPSVDC